MITVPVAETVDTRAGYRQALQWLFSFANYEIVPANVYEASKFNLDRMRALLAALGNPQEHFRSVHIAGTKGKGSTAAIGESILRAAGYKTGLYTSPHLHTFRERICVAGAMIAPEALVEGVARLRAIQTRFPDVTVFELMTALAFDHFAHAGVQIAVVEVGIGGRLDATNVITPRVSVLTSISYDHTAVLGDTLSKIAGEKAGIIKPGIPVVSAPQVDEALAVFEQVARERNAPITLVGRDWTWEMSEQNMDHQDFRVVGRVGNLPQVSALASDLSYNLRLHLLGAHQVVNATTALAAAHVLAEGDTPIMAEAVSAGVANARWAGRFEVLTLAPYLIVDGAHNRDSAHQLIATLDALLPGARVRWILGASSDKDIGGIFDELLARSPELIVTRSHHPRAADPRDLAKLAEARGASLTMTESVDEALALARMRASASDVTVVTGSLFVVADARAFVLRSRGEPVESDE
jgi:dihydrofolate synthase/folylpolyglutamate synthase